MRFRGVSEAARAECRCDLTTMIDVTFLLLVFFLLTIRFKVLEQKLPAQLPPGRGEDVRPDTPPPEKIRVRIDVTGTLAARSVRYSVGPFATGDVDALRARLVELHQALPDTGAVIDARDGAQCDEVVGVLDTLIGVGFRDVAFAAARRTR